MQRREFLTSTTAATAGMLTASQASLHAKPTPNPKKPPNIIFVLADQWRFSAFGHGTDEGVETPNIDQLAKEGCLHENAYACNPVCTPNRAVLLTGKYSHQTGMITNNLMIPPAEKCMAESLKAAGYATHYIGKYHLDGSAKPGYVPSGWRRRGFDTFEGFNRGHAYFDSKTFSNDGELLRPDVFEPTYQTDRAIEYIEQHKDEPFYMYLSWGPPHTPYRAPKDFDQYVPEDLKLRPNVPPKLHNNKRVRKGLAGYYGLCTALDHEMGRLTAALERLDLTDDTILVFTSDHGDMHGSQGLYFKGHPDEESLHVPLVVRWPGHVPAGSKSSTLFNSLDMMPTLLSMCHVEPPSTCSGRNLQATMAGHSESPDSKTSSKTAQSVDADYIYTQGKMNSAAAWRCVLTDEHKLAMTADGSVTHLIERKNDPFELNNLANKKSRRGVQNELVALLKETARKTGDPFPNAITPAKAMYSEDEAKQARS